MPSLGKLVVAYRRWAEFQTLDPDIPRVQVDDIAARVAAFYEKIRGIVGWTEEHLLRKSAIVRIFRRSILVTEGEGAIAETLVKDLVRGGYFPNAVIPEAKVPALGEIIGKYLFLFERLRAHPTRDRRILEEWLYAIAASEVEAFLDPPIREEALLEFATEDLDRRITLPKPIPEQERENLIFVAIRESLYKLDEPIITYELLKRYIPGWESLSPDGHGRETLEQFAADMSRWHGSIEDSFHHSLSGRFYWAAAAIDTPYLILGDLLTDLAKKGALTEEALPSGEALHELVLARYRERIAGQSKKSLRAAFYSTLSIFITKVVLAFAVEVPLDRLTGEYQTATLLTNIALPPLLMIALVFWGFRRPSRRDANRVIEELNRILAGDPSSYHIRLPGRRPIFMLGFVGLLYVAGAAATFGAIIWALTTLHFSALSQGIFIFFVSLIAYAGLRIRERSKELIVEEKPPGFLHDIVLFFTFPIVELGRWLSGALLKIRLVALIMDALIELPLKFFLDFLEQWRAFLREKKQGIR